MSEKEREGEREREVEGGREREKERKREEGREEGGNVRGMEREGRGDPQVCPVTEIPNRVDSGGLGYVYNILC